MLDALKKAVCDANLELAASGVVIYTWGNVSGIDRDSDKWSSSRPGFRIRE